MKLFYKAFLEDTYFDQTNFILLTIYMIDYMFIFAHN